MTDSLGAVSAPAGAGYGFVPSTPTPRHAAAASTFPPTLNSVLTPSTAIIYALPGPLVATTLLPSLATVPLVPPTQVGAVSLSTALPDDGDRVEVTFRVRSIATPTVCRVVRFSCLGLPTVSRDGAIVTVRATAVATAPQTEVRFDVTNGAGTLTVPVTFAVAPPQTVPDYDIVGVELSQGVQRETASARPAPPDRDAPYDGVILAGTEGEWGHPESFSGEVPPARIRVWVVAHGIRAKTAPPPELWVSLGRPQASRNGAVVRYGEAPLLSAPASVPVTPETGLSPGLRADGAVPYVFHWVPDVSVPRIDARLVSPRECGGCSTPTTT